MTDRSEFESIGEPEVRRRIAAGEYGTPSNPAFMRASGWLAHRDAEAAAKRDAREEESLSIAREANSIAREARRMARNANIWAAIAAIIAALAMYFDRST